MLIYQVALKGVKESNYLSIVLDCDSIPPVQGQVVGTSYQFLCACVHAARFVLVEFMRK